MGTQMNTRLIMAKAVRSYTPFKRGNISAITAKTGDFVQIGQLPGFLSDQLYGALLDNDLYVVYSFQTPIGWSRMNKKNEWFIPDIRYSSTTIHHQGLLRVITQYPHMYS